MIVIKTYVSIVLLTVLALSRDQLHHPCRNLHLTAVHNLLGRNLGHLD